MNRQRRAKLRGVITKLTEVRNEIECIREEEDESRDNMPENLKDSARYEGSEECSEAMDSVIDFIDEAINSIEEVI